ncbi:primase homolog protein isoform X3 [Cucumis sativus]|uniref:primase homolog protein isoform X3 n=1 Tax=Cucumis sativus TaxID=3659 RepID=UPI0012F51102|nr:primase homolog protein isoform X3 [Cucumis sativus]
MPINSTFTFNSNFNFQFKFINHRSFPFSHSLNNFSISSSPSRFLRFCTTRLSSAVSHAPPSPPPVKHLMERMDLVGIVCDEHCIPGKYYCLFCPKCKGGRLMERSLSLHVIPTGDFAMWRCFQFECGWAGQIFADGKLAFNGFGKITKMVGRSSKESLVLEPLCDEVTIAFTYRQNGQLVGCKYRTMDKRFWQEKGTAKFLYGIDDINDADELIIVEGEMDKLSVEEAGFLNCISVPGGAPNKVSTDTVPPIEKDTAYQYLWSCKDYLDKVSRVILATDSDVPGQALAEELARRLGKNRCWRVSWPYKDGFNRFKDANEVLVHLGPDALKKAIEDAKFYQLSSSNQIQKEEDLFQEHRVE